MAYSIIVRTKLTGKRKIQFEETQKKHEESSAAILRRMIDFWIENH